jgi:hypothetical protein
MHRQLPVDCSGICGPIITELLELNGDRWGPCTAAYQLPCPLVLLLCEVKGVQPRREAVVASTRSPADGTVDLVVVHMRIFFKLVSQCAVVIGSLSIESEVAHTQPLRTELQLPTSGSPSSASHTSLIFIRLSALMITISHRPHSIDHIA